MYFVAICSKLTYISQILLFYDYIYNNVVTHLFTRVCQNSVCFCTVDIVASKLFVNSIKQQILVLP